LHVTGEDLVNDDLFVAAGEYATELATVPDARVSEVAFGGEFRLRRSVASLVWTPYRSSALLLITVK